MQGVKLELVRLDLREVVVLEVARVLNGLVAKEDDSATLVTQRYIFS